ncbi:MAG: FAD-dependent monooxygenase, partial [Candidatus Eremiobacteraeota bacterium]|nr:FAD-dependent monooxygenase [Candidatus Eremiobacteraeota bacterium]
MSARRWNVAVLGGGPAGCATALALERNGISDVCVIDPDPSAGLHVGETLPPQTRVLLDELGLGAEFAGEGHEESLGSCSSWGSDALGYNDFLLDPYGRGWHLDRLRFDSFMRRSAASRAVSICSGAHLLRWEPDVEGGFRLHLRHHGAAATLRARYVVDATGIRSAFARRAGSRPLSFDRLAFVYGFFDAYDAASPTRLTMLETTDDGWWYAAGLPGRRVAVAFATDPETVREQTLSAEDRWFARLLRTRHI